MKVTNHTRAGRDGKIIACPHCGKLTTVYHFAWSALHCRCCKRTVEKQEFFVVQFIDIRQETPK